MSVFTDVLNEIFSRVGADVAPLSTIISVLLMTLIMSVFEFVVYRSVSRRYIYNKQFHIAILVIPFFIGSIVMALQSNIVITLGTIDALAIIRFRTAIKDSVDMIYLLWSIFIGITCGCRLYESCILTSLMVAAILLAVEFLTGKLFKNPYLLILNCDKDIENELNELIKKYSRHLRLKSRNYTGKGIDYVYELSVSSPKELSDKLNEVDGVNRFSLLEYDSNDII